MAIRLHRLAWAERTALRLIKEYGAPCRMTIDFPGQPIPGQPGRVGPSLQETVNFSGVVLSNLTDIQIPSNVVFSDVLMAASSEFRPSVAMPSPPTEYLLGAATSIFKEGQWKELRVKHVQQVVPNGNSIIFRFFLGA
ncbi:hypothetical protein AMA2_62 [Achromobacter phage AMA2]|nr:hypothetical protein AMA2_62 [Achromobacter phage AMA2]